MLVLNVAKGSGALGSNVLHRRSKSLASLLSHSVAREPIASSVMAVTKALKNNNEKNQLRNPFSGRLLIHLHIYKHKCKIKILVVHAV
jgi:hypothetical protein